jgi:hypothetical protein
MSKGPLAKTISRDGKGEMTLVVGVGDTLVEGSKQCNPRTIGPKDSNGPLPSEGNGINLQTGHKGFAFDAFQLLKNTTTLWVWIWLWTLLSIPKKFISWSY